MSADDQTLCHRQDRGRAVHLVSTGQSHSPAHRHPFLNLKHKHTHTHKSYSAFTADISSLKNTSRWSWGKSCWCNSKLHSFQLITRCCDHVPTAVLSELLANLKEWNARGTRVHNLLTLCNHESTKMSQWHPSLKSQEYCLFYSISNIKITEHKERKEAETLASHFNNKCLTHKKYKIHLVL